MHFVQEKGEIWLHIDYIKMSLFAFINIFVIINLLTYQISPALQGILCADSQAKSSKIAPPELISS